MNHYMDVDPYMIKERNEQMPEEVSSLRLADRLRENRNPRGSGNTGGSRVLVTLVAAALAAGVLVLALLTAATKPARAASPGSNGVIAFASYQDGDSEIYRMAPDGFGGAYSANLTDNSFVNDMRPAWNAEGTRIAFVSDRNDPNGDIYRMDASGNNETRLTINPAVDTEPAWFPTDTKLAFVSNRADAKGTVDYEIYVMTLDQNANPIGNPQQITTSAFDDGQPAISPDGKLIAFTSSRDDNRYEIYVMKARPESATNKPVRLTKNSVSDSEPDWSSDGSKIVFESTRGGSDREIVMMNSDGTGQKLLTNNSSADLNPVFSPDGRRIAFGSSQMFGDPGDIFRMRANGANPFNLTNSTSGDSEVAWQPL